MSVYTTITEPQLKNFLQGYNLGELVEFEGITDGIENTNYFVTTDKGEYVLTLFEVLTLKELPFYVELMAFLNEHDIPSAHPIKNNQHSYLGKLNGKPSILVQRLHGKSVNQPTITQCESIGTVLADLHLRGKYFKMNHENSRGAHWRNEAGKQLLPSLPEDEANLLNNELREYALHNLDALPQGIVHADLFRDNVLFEKEQLTGLLDFYNACNDSLLYDIAITVNDWCVTEQGELDFELAHALCDSYRQERQLETAEITAWPVMLRIAAMRFWLSRLWSQQNPKEGELTFLKNPDEFKNIIHAHIKVGEHLCDVW
jgi:homoserine kinase type II